jgi:hypothetical protein
MGALGTGVVTSDARDRAFAELMSANVITFAGFNDHNGNAAYRLVGFPSGEEGLRLRGLFDRF